MDGMHHGLLGMRNWNRIDPCAVAVNRATL